MNERVNLDWGRLPFKFNGIDGYVVSRCRDDQWTPFEVIKSEFLTLHVAAGVLHYSQTIFEGLKCFEGPDSKRRLFRPQDNARRFAQSAEMMRLPHLSLEKFMTGVILAVNLNRRFQPPYGSGASLYIRPFEFASAAQLGVNRSTEHTFIVYATAVGPYFQEGFNKTIALYLTDWDRVPEKGMGNAKAGPNYGITIASQEEAKVFGCAAPLFTQPPAHRIITETHASNIAFIIDGKLVTPKQNSFILNSITRQSVIKICEELGIEVEQRDIEISELANITEAMGVGTGAIISPVGRIRDRNGFLKTKIENPDSPGPLSRKIYEKLLTIQQGEEEDRYHWNYIVEEI